MATDSISNEVSRVIKQDVLFCCCVNVVMYILLIYLRCHTYCVVVDVVLFTAIMLLPAVRCFCRDIVISDSV